MLNRLAIMLLLALAAASSAAAATARTNPGAASHAAWLAATVPSSPTALFDIGALVSENINASIDNGGYFVTDLGDARSGTFRRIRNAGRYSIPFVMDGNRIIGYAPTSPVGGPGGSGGSNVLPVAPGEIVEFVSLGSDSWTLVQYLPLHIENFGLLAGYAALGIPPTANPPANWFQLGPVAGKGPEPDYAFAVSYGLHGGKIHTHGIHLMLPGDTPNIELRQADIDPVDEGPKPWAKAPNLGAHISGRALVDVGGGRYQFLTNEVRGSVGYHIGPSSFGQGFTANIDFPLIQPPTLKGTGGALVFKVTPNGTVTPFQRAWVSNTGNFVEIGKSAFEACGLAYPYDHRGSIWKADSPCDDSDYFDTPGWGNISIVATDYTSSKAGNNAGLAMREYGAHGEGLDLGFNGADSRMEFTAVHGDARTPALAVDPPTAQILYPVQSAFSATLSSDLLAVTGDGTLAKIGFNSALYNRHSDFSTRSGLYTAPVAGIYSFSGQVTLSRFSSAHYRKVRVEVISTDRAYSYFAGLPNPDADGDVSVPFDFSIPMTAGATAYVALDVEGGSKGVGVTTASYFTGRLVE